AAADVEDAVGGRDGRGREERVLVVGERRLEPLGVGRPVRALGPVPRPGLLGVRGVDVVRADHGTPPYTPNGTISGYSRGMTCQGAGSRRRRTRSSACSRCNRGAPTS